ncbi:hypothetical protein V5O48_001852 [Marasmius crinis-equi]|uniref:Uncharacterized protein n=1 Tax=Marasmius crinis-equi TaxID=585013 RepID=A0ABR3FX61_9AGAR
MLTVSRRFYHSINAFRRTLHDIDKLLLRFFTLGEIRTFRNIQACDGCLISGSLALQYFAGVVWADSDMDIYCYPESFTRLVHFLLRIGYDYSKEGRMAELQAAIKNIQQGVGTFAPYTQRADAILGVLSFTRLRNGSTRKIQIVAVRLLSAHEAPSAFKKYSERGWQVVGSASALSGLRRAGEFVRDRAVGDSATWIIELRGVGMTLDSDSIHLKWLLAHSWSHLKTTRGLVRVGAEVGGRCSWRWPLTFAAGCQHLRLHGPDLKEDCDICEHALVDE